MKKYEEVQNNLNKAISSTVEHRADFVFNPRTDFTRNRKLTMKDSLKFFLSMEGGSITNETQKFLFDKREALALTGKVEPVGTITSSAIVQQRQKLSYKAFENVFHEFNAYSEDGKKYKDYNLFAVDGTALNIARNPDDKGSYHKKQNYNQLHLNMMYNIEDGTYRSCVIQKLNEQNEHKALVEMLSTLNVKKKNIVICDRGYQSYNNIAHFTENKIDFVIRAKSSNGFKEVTKLPNCECDEDIVTTITTTATNEDKAKGYRKINVHNKTGVRKNGQPYSEKTGNAAWDFTSPYKIKYRAVKFKLQTGEYEVLLTSLPRDRFSINKLKELYHKRWNIEESFKTLKYTTGLINLHCKNENSVKQEIYAALTMYNFCTRIIASISLPGTKTKYKYVINKTTAFAICIRYFRNTIPAIDNFKKLVLDNKLPIRPGRSDDRKLKPKSFTPFCYRVAA